ncbi:hypothetical protein HJG43_04215 [Kineosporiaceae bacterium SCSIO 59966]|nr:hypothetical protein HJG43_04215 [Kineosporiaceae bacterium SCSIO 59966]
MQATVLRYDRDDATGACVLDDGVELDLAPGALDGSGLRHLRPGQRVTVTVSGPVGARRVDSVRILGVSP